MNKAKLVVVLTWLPVVFLNGCASQHTHHGHDEEHISARPAAMSPEVQVIDLEQNEEYQPLLTGRNQTCGMRSGRVYLTPGQDCGEHSTKAQEEMLIFLQGQGHALIGPDKIPHEIGRGKVIYIPPHTIHNMKNTGDKPLVYIYCVTPIQEE